MNILVISYRAPGLHLRGDQARLALLLRDLATEHAVTVVTTQPLTTPVSRDCSVVVAAPRRVQRVLSALVFGLRGRPLQTGWSMPPMAWREADNLAAEADVALVVTTRSLRGPLPCPIVLDHVDALSLNMRQRSGMSVGVPERLLAVLESRLLSRWERRVAGWSAAQIVTSVEAANALARPPAPHVIPAAWDGALFQEPPGHVRDIDCIFTGDMRYPPNREAASWLAREVLPRIRRRSPSLRAVFVGRNAAKLDLDGVEVAGDVSDVGAYLRRAKVALVAARGTGSPFKTLEAAANGAAIVARPWAVDCYGMEALRAETADEFAEHAISLLSDDVLRAERARAAVPALLEHRSTVIAARFAAVLVSTKQK